MALRRALIKLTSSRTTPVISCRIRTLNTQTSQKENENQSSKQTHFGFQTVDEEEKWKKGQEIKV